jgi:upstream activation factor subunit UAF30
MTTTALKVTKKKTTTSTATPTPVPVPAPVLAPTVPVPTPTPTTETLETTTTTKKRAPKMKIIHKDETSTVDAVQPVPSAEDIVEVEIKRKKRVASRETYLQTIEELCQSINDEILTSKDDKNVNGKTLKFLRTINKNLTILKKDAGKLIRQKKKVVDGGEDVTTSKNKVSSGFLKPVPISAAMSEFTGWSKNELKSRVDVTKFLCNYIKDHNLQNPADRRQFTPDKNLAKLLDFKVGTQLTYFDMQSHLKKHFPKVTAVTA